MTGLDVYLNEVQTLVEAKGWNTGDFPGKVCLMYGEVGEVFDKWHRGRSSAAIAEELTDVFIHLMGLFSMLGESPDEHYRDKMLINWKRDPAAGPR